MKFFDYEMVDIGGIMTFKTETRYISPNKIKMKWFYEKTELTYEDNKPVAYQNWEATIEGISQDEIHSITYPQITKGFNGEYLVKVVLYVKRKNS